MASRFINALSVPGFDLGQRMIMRGTDTHAERLGERFAMMAFRVDKKHRNRTLENLEMAFPEWSDAQRLETAKGVFRHFGRMFVQFMRTPVRTPADVVAQTEVVGLEHLEAAEEIGKGILILSGHIGNWEWMGHWLSATGRKLSVIVRDANQSGVNDRLVQLRNAAGYDVMPRGAAARGAIVKLRRKELVGLLADQNAGDMFVPFFGKPVGCVTGPAVLHTRTGAPLIPSYCIWQSPGRYRVEFHQPIEAEADVEPVLSITRQVNADLESIIRRHPDQWLWMHDRWKSARQQGML